LAVAVRGELPNDCFSASANELHLALIAGLELHLINDFHDPEGTALNTILFL
jgi:hypothetical protein